jgi:hypothetical protein
MTRTRAVLVIGGLALAAVAGQGIVTASGPADWNTYRNARYGYEIRFPDQLEAWPTGPPGERDGRSIRVGLKEHASPVPVIDIHVRFPTSGRAFLAGEEPRDMDVTRGDVEIGGIPAREVTYRWKSNGDVVFVELHFGDVLIVFDAQPGVVDAHDTIWWDVISTFRVRDD